MAKQSVSLIDSQRSETATIIMLAWPIFVEQMLLSLVQAADAAMVGSLGAAATASVAINHSPNMLINGVIMALGVGFTSVIARSIGAKNMEKAKSLTKQAILVVLLVGVLLTVFYYSLARQLPLWMGGKPEILEDAERYNKILSLSLVFRGMTMALTAIYRGYGNSKTPMLINVLVNLINVIGNFFMIYPTREMTVMGKSVMVFGCGWGVTGAAISTSLAGTLGGILLLLICFVSQKEPQLSVNGGFHLHRRDMSEVLRISFPAMLEQFAIGTAFIVVGRAVAKLGTIAIAAQNLTGNAESLCFMPGFAFGASTTTLFGQSLGAGQYDKARRYVTKTIKIGTAIMMVASILMFLGSTQVMRVFTPDQKVIALGGRMLKILALIQIPQMIAMIYSGALKGAGDSKSPFLITLISMWGVRILGTVLCVYVLHLGLIATCVSMCADNVFRCLLFHLRYRQERWKKYGKTQPAL